MSEPRDRPALLEKALYYAIALVEDRIAVGAPTNTAIVRAALRELLAYVRTLEAERDRLKRDVAYHDECRPNRQQAEAWLADAKAMNDRWADEVAAHRATRETLEAERDALRAKQATTEEALQKYGQHSPSMGGWPMTDPVATGDV